jgi:hypothetical protein
MNLVGKIFALLIMVMSLVFTSFTVMVYSTHKNWRNKAIEEGKRLAQSNKTIDEQLNEIDRLKTDFGAKEEAAKKDVASAIQDRDIARGQVAMLTNEKNMLEAKAREAAEAMDRIALALDARRQEVGVLRAEFLKALLVQNQHFDANVKLTNDKNQGVFEVQRLEDYNRALGGKIVGMQTILAHHGLSEHEPDNYKQPPRVEGLILALNEGGDLVTISLGTDDGILKNHQLEVFRLGATPKYLGRIQVIETRADQAVAKVIPETRKGPFEKFDHVATKLR